ncbi:hypothetical protein EI42_02230 [Thermosporothrix hazakensis]|uniref:Uncharacterized protein n=1 Tax=Thermosporothrix hazakensis TaxID=644383 RepID=A0A326U9P2_THEHA|nr:hypothetical protein EI42_02230 [Thermosporothrix hazakensis]
MGKRTILFPAFSFPALILLRFPFTKAIADLYRRPYWHTGPTLSLLFQAYSY